MEKRVSMKTSPTWPLMIMHQTRCHCMKNQSIRTYEHEKGWCMFHQIHSHWYGHESSSSHRFKFSISGPCIRSSFLTVKLSSIPGFTVCVHSSSRSDSLGNCVSCECLSLSFVPAAWVLYAISALGITAGAHRLWSHKSYQAKWPLRLFLMIGQSLAGQHTIFSWSRDHRVHHKFSDTDADPHNCKRGFFFW